MTITHSPVKVILHIDGERSSLGFHHAAVVVEFLEEFCIQRRRSHNQLEFRAFMQNRLENAEQNVDVQRAFMRLVNHDGRILPKEPVAAEFLQQDAIRHHLDGSVALALLPESDFRGDKRFVLEFLAQAVRNGNRCKPAGLCYADFENTHVIPAEAGFSFSNSISEILAFARMTNCSIPL